MLLICAQDLRKGYLAQGKNVIEAEILLTKNPQERLAEKETLYVRIPRPFLDYIHNMVTDLNTDKPDGEKLSAKELMERMLILTLYKMTDYDSTAPAISFPSERFIKLPGNKFDIRMQQAINDILSNQHYESSLETCAGALGIHANFDVADDETICDIDSMKILLYKEI